MTCVDEVYILEAAVYVSAGVRAAGNIAPNRSEADLRIISPQAVGGTVIYIDIERGQESQPFQ